MSIRVGTRVQVVGKDVIGTVAYIGTTLFSNGMMSLSIQLNYRYDSNKGPSWIFPAV